VGLLSLAIFKTRIPDRAREPGSGNDCQPLRGPERPEAIVAMNDLVAMLVLEAAEQVGLQIPNDLGIAGFDNLDSAVANNLTTVAQRPYEIGSEAARLLLQRIHGDKDANKQYSCPRN